MLSLLVEGSDQTNRTRKIFLELSVRCPRPPNLLTRFQKRYFRALKLGASPQKIATVAPFLLFGAFLAVFDAPRRHFRLLDHFLHKSSPT